MNAYAAAGWRSMLTGPPVCFPLPEDAWVKAAAFTAWGHTYRFEFPKPSCGDFNYYDCP
jgi:hypothetical protein